MITGLAWKAVIALRFLALKSLMVSLAKDVSKFRLCANFCGRRADHPLSGMFLQTHPSLNYCSALKNATLSVQLREIKEQLAGLDSRIANYFMATMRAIADEAKNGPRLFTFRSREVGLSSKQLLSRPLELQLWCEAEGCQHPVIESGKGVYPIDQPHEWVTQDCALCKFCAESAFNRCANRRPAINTFFGPKTTETWKIADQLDLAKAIIDKLPAEIKDP